MKKNRKLIITQEQLERLNEVTYFNGTFNPGNLSSKYEQDRSSIGTLDAQYTNQGTLTPSQKNTSITIVPDENGTISSKDADMATHYGTAIVQNKIKSQQTETRSFSKKAVEEARIRTIKQEGKTYSKKDFAKMILGK